MIAKKRAIHTEKRKDRYAYLDVWIFEYMIRTLLIFLFSSLIGNKAPTMGVAAFSVT